VLFFNWMFPLIFFFIFAQSSHAEQGGAITEIVAMVATIGVIGNADHMNISLGKAGRKRWLGRKPHNRGTSMNPVSHPMGGGEGRTAGGRHPCSPTGVLAKGGKTRKKRKPSNASIIRRRRPGPHYAGS